MALGLTPQDIVDKGEYSLLVKAEHWGRVQLSEVARVQNGFAFKSKYFNHEKGLPLIRIRDVTKSETEHRYGGDYDSSYVVNSDDVLIGMDGDFKAARWRGEPGLLNQRVCRLQIRSDNYDEKFLFICIQPFLDAINAETSSVTVKHLSSRSVEKIPLPLPPLNEQKRIVIKIEELFSELDKGIESLKTSLEQIKVYRQAILKNAFEGKLTADWRAENIQIVEAIKETLARVETPPRPNRWKTRSQDVIPGHAALAVNDPGLALPDGWAWVKLVDVARMESGHTPSRKHPEWWQGDVRWIGIADARPRHGKVISETSQHTNEDGLANSAARLLPKGTVCVSRTASVGYVVTMGTEMATSQDFVNWVPTEAVTSEWLNLIFSADRETLRRFGKGTTHKTIYFPEWMAVSIALPSVAEQLEIVERVQEIFSILENQEEIIARSLDQSEALRQSILKSAFSGKLVEQDPNDEPASELLERIKAEKKENEKGKRVKKGKAA